MKTLIRLAFIGVFITSQVFAFPAHARDLITDRTNFEQIANLSGISTEALAEISRGERSPTREEKIVLYTALVELTAAVKMELASVQKALHNKTNPALITSALGIGILATPIVTLLRESKSFPISKTGVGIWYGVGSVLFGLGTALLYSNSKDQSIQADQETIQLLRNQLNELEFILETLKADLIQE